MAYLSLIAAFTLNAVANILLKIGSSKGLSWSNSPFVLVASNWHLLLGLALFAGNVIFYFIALKSFPLFVAYPVMVVMSFVIINGYALTMLGESVTPLQVLGYVLIIGGLLLVTLNVR